MILWVRVNSTVKLNAPLTSTKAKDVNLCQRQVSTRHFQAHHGQCVIGVGWVEDLGREYRWVGREGCNIQSVTTFSTLMQLKP